MTKLWMIPLALSTSILMGCQMAQKIPAKPERPKLESLTKNEDGGITLDKNDSVELILYIYHLEDGYE